MIGLGLLGGCGFSIQLIASFIQQLNISIPRHPHMPLYAGGILGALLAFIAICGRKARWW